jgi:uncharacterized surface anchored protein
MLAVTVVNPNENNVTISDADLLVIPVNSTEPIMKGKTDQNGKCLIKGLEPDEYKVKVQREFVSSEKESDILDLKIQKRIDVKISLSINAAAIKGVVTDKRGIVTDKQGKVISGISQATIEVQGVAQQRIAIGYTDAEGNFIIGYLQPGDYQILIYRENYHTKTVPEQGKIELKKGEIHDIGTVLLTKINVIKTSQPGSKKEQTPKIGDGGSGKQE